MTPRGDEGHAAPWEVCGQEGPPQESHQRLGHDQRASRKRKRPILREYGPLGGSLAAVLAFWAALEHTLALPFLFAVWASPLEEVVSSEEDATDVQELHGGTRRFFEKAEVADDTVDVLHPVNG